jgi:hypothetical protein
MKLAVLILLSLFSPIISIAQINGEDEVYLEGDLTEAKFNGGGLDKFYDFINKEFDFSKATKAGKMITAFTVDTNGEIKNIKVVQFVDVETATELIRVLKKAPKWEPAKKGGKPINIEIRLPLDFSLSNKIPTSNKETTSLMNFQKEELIESSNKIELNSQDESKNSGGVSGFYKIIKENFRTPDIPGLKGKILVSFTINEDGKLSDYKIIKELGYGTGKELIRVLKLTNGKWTPAYKDGKPVKTTFTIPLSINVPND